MKTFQNYHDELVLGCQISQSNYSHALINPSLFSPEDFIFLKKEAEEYAGEYFSFMWQVMKFGLEPEDEFVTYC